MTKPPKAQGKPSDAPPMVDHSLSRREWVNEPAVRAIGAPLRQPRHPLNELRDEHPDVQGPVDWVDPTPAQLAALLETAPWERDQGHNARPRHQWLLDLADACPEVTFHGFARDRFQHSIVVEGFDRIGPAERALGSVRWVGRSLAWTAFSRGDDRHLHRTGDPDHAGDERAYGEAGEDARRPEDAGRWHHWRWWD